MSATVPAMQIRLPRKAIGKLIATELKQAWREPVALLLGVLVPVVFLVIFGLAPAFQKNVPTTSTTYMTEYTPILIGLTLVLIALISMPIPIVMQRQSAYLRRLSTTPVAPGWLLVAQVLVNVLLAVLAAVLVVVGGVLLFHAHAPADIPGFILAALLATAAIFALGLIIAAVAPDPRIAGPAGAVLLYPLMFLAGLWTPRETMSPLMHTLSDYSPLGAAVQAMLTAVHGGIPSAQSLLVMAAYAVGFGFVAVRFFRWE